MHVFTPATIEVLNAIPYVKEMTKVLQITRLEHMIEIISASSSKEFLQLKFDEPCTALWRLEMEFGEPCTALCRKLEIESVI